MGVGERNPYGQGISEGLTVDVYGRRAVESCQRRLWLLWRQSLDSSIHGNEWLSLQVVLQL